ncbi:STAS domain-containing protein [Actinoplanes flavus]|uniref:STAS domain-containing protein n=1 Tax=Actinoplanes flavus TaxID=2820290 RepID=A0ABS3UZY8_9ACTN|nr:STAS domain-containing protein [Actinoplanes flavus]MBO3744145.1 STAS domain-containing protein [Actinoplanes flavus]
MTAVPGAEPRTVTLICDECGDTVNAPEVAHDEEIVWPRLGPLGWSGSPFAAGQHRCPQCILRPPPHDRLPAGRPQLGASYDLREHADLGIVVITPLTDVDAEATVVLRKALEQALDTHRHVLVDLHAAEVIDSAGLGLLVRAHQHAKRRGGTLTLAAPSRYLRTVLHTMRLEGVFDIAENATAVLDAHRGTEISGR